MNCDRYQELLSAALDGELTDIEQRDLRSHLDECPVCRERSDQMHEQHEMLSTSRVPAQPARLRAGIKERLGIREHRSARAPWMRGLAPEPPPVEKAAPRHAPVVSRWGRMHSVV